MSAADTDPTFAISAVEAALDALGLSEFKPKFIEVTEELITPALKRPELAKALKDAGVSDPVARSKVRDYLSTPTSHSVVEPSSASPASSDGVRITNYCLFLLLPSLQYWLTQ